MVHSYMKKMIPFTPTASDTTCFEIFDQDRLLTLLRSNNCLQTACTYIMDTLKCSGGSVYFRVKGDEGLATLKILTKAQFYAEFPALTNGPDKIIAQCWRSFKIICSPLEISCDNNRLLLNIYEPSIYEYILREPNVSELTSFCLTRVESMFKMLCNNVDRVVTYFATWLWLILQGHRQISAAALSGQGGDGKSAIANGFRNLLPDRVCTTLDRNDFGLFNSKKDNKMFCMCEEWDPKVSSSVINNLKNSITEGIVSSRSVGQNSVDVKNVSNFLITSNYDISYLTGRKFFHINVPKLSMEKDEEIEYKTFCRRMSGGDALISEEDHVHHRSICEALYLFLSRFDGKPLDNIPPECISTEQTSAIPPRPHPTRSSTEILDAFLASKYFDTISKLYNTGTLYGTSMISFPSKEIKDALKIFYTNRSASNYEYPLIDAHHLEAQFDNYLAGIGFMRTKRSSNFFDISILTPYYYLSEHWTSAPQSKLDWQRNLATNGFNELKRQIETQKDLDKFSVQNQNPENQI